MRFTVYAPEHKAFDDSDGTLRVVRAAKALFLRTGGSAQFSIRGVAKEAGLSMGALQHFFPTRDQLVAAMLEFVANDYEQQWQQLSRALPLSGKERLMKAIEYLVDDAFLVDTRHFFFSFWALSCHNQFAATLHEQICAHHTKNVASFVRAACADFTTRQCREAALQIVALTDGLMLFTSPGAKHFTTPAAMVRATKRTVCMILGI